MSTFWHIVAALAAAYVVLLGVGGLRNVYRGDCAPEGGERVLRVGVLSSLTLLAGGYLVVSALVVTS